MPLLQFKELSLYFEESGEGTPVLLLHGLGSSGRDWESVAPRLTGCHRVIVPDERGHGRSGKPPGAYGVPRFARDITGLCDALGLFSANDPDAYLRATKGLVGWSVMRHLGGITCPVLVLVVHGTKDSVVDIVNGRQATRQFLQTSDYGDDGVANDSIRPVATQVTRASVPGGRAYTVEDYVYGGVLVARHIEIQGMDHAWPGGDSRYPFADPSGPDGTSLMWDFFRRHTRS